VRREEEGRKGRRERERKEKGSKKKEWEGKSP